MLLIRKRAYARAGLVGNPSDGYHGKTISFRLLALAVQVPEHLAPRRDANKPYS